jgi:hypothetical protein
VTIDGTLSARITARGGAVLLVEVKKPIKVVHGRDGNNVSFDSKVIHDGHSRTTRDTPIFPPEESISRGKNLIYFSLKYRQGNS